MHQIMHQIMLQPFHFCEKCISSLNLAENLFRFLKILVRYIEVPDIGEEKIHFNSFSLITAYNNRIKVISDREMNKYHAIYEPYYI